MKIYIGDNVDTSITSFIKQSFSNINVVTNYNQGLDCNILISYPYKLTKDYLDDFNNLTHILLLTSGFDNIDLDYLSNRGIKLYNAKDIYSIPIAEYVLAYILAYYKKVFTFYNLKIGKEWKNTLALEDLTNKTVGIIGAGDIGREIAKRLKAFDTKVLGYKRTYENIEYFDQIYTNNDGLNSIIKESDILIIALSLNDSTKHFINKDILNKMKKSAVLINIARGDVVNQNDLITALENKTIEFAILDVTSPEPLPKDSKLWELDNVLITPHHSNSSYLTNERLSKLLNNTLFNIFNNQKNNNQII